MMRLLTIQPLRRGPLLIAAMVAAILAMMLPPTTAHAAAPTVIHIAPDGDDSGSGSEASPFRTLAKANAHLEETKPATDVEVRLAPGTYTETGTRWTYHSEHATLITGDGGTATFSGQDTYGNYILKFGPEGTDRVAMNLTVRHLGFTGSSNGLQVINATTVTLSSLVFNKIGTHYTGIGTGYAALSIQNVSGVGVWSPKFTDIVNTADQQGLVHAIYAANNADNITVHDPVVSRVSGDPLRFRNGSDNFVINGGSVSNSGRYSAFSEWYNDTIDEARSTGARFEGVSVTTQGFDAPLVHGRTACFASSAGTTPITPCSITDIP
ncbi:MAG TPA: DUF1565 domain-containing protein [Candidatus Avipropionibacterium avicola]|uniref:DUF1565 domain-containing protein n=1 Tax=Candidatus Avipropionibacterium avicola TaxID=2840701 RepID=A0A9D1GWY7_9ACTN|nr:DUF1565 domain-containing protein [Candidatus Avipropionibacterium avicola]